MLGYHFDDNIYRLDSAPALLLPYDTIMYSTMAGQWLLSV